MRKNNSSARVCGVFIVLSLLLSWPAGTLGNWGLEVGRADETDNVRLLADWLAFKMAEKRISDSVQRPLMKERQRQLLGLGPAPVSPDDILDGVYGWWMKEVMTPAQLIALNPAASCAQAQLAMQTLLGMMRQRQLIGIDESTSGRGAEVSRILQATEAMMFQRCRDEALDECVATGRYIQIVQLANGEARQAQLSGEFADVEAWAKNALKQCAIYDLGFVSTSTVSDGGIRGNRTLTGTIRITLEDMPGVNAAQYSVLYGKSIGGIGDVTVECFLSNVTVRCSRGIERGNGMQAWIRGMDMRHREFYVDRDGISRERTVGENKLPMEISGDAITTDMIISVPKGPSIRTEWPLGGLGFHIAHQKDSGGMPTNVKFDRFTTPGVYPVIYEFTYADQDRLRMMSATDSTVFKLIHKPKPEPFPARSPEPIRKPLKPRVG